MHGTQKEVSANRVPRAPLICEHMHLTLRTATTIVAADAGLPSSHKKINAAECLMHVTTC